MSYNCRRAVRYMLALAVTVLGQSPTAGAAMLSSDAANTPAAYGVERQALLELGPAKVAELQTETASWQPVAEVIFVPAARQTKGNERGVRTGTLSWRITKAGAVVQDNRTGALAHLPELTSAIVRPREVLYDSRTRTVWLYGAGLYRYRLGGHQIEHLQPAGASWPVIRKIAQSAAGLWLVTSSSVFLLDGVDGTLKKLQDSALARQHFSNLTAVGEMAWVVTAEGHLARMTVLSPHQIALEISCKRLPGNSAELTAVGRNLWLLLAERRGEHYQLAVVEQDSPMISLMAGHYDSLTAKGGQLIAGTGAEKFRIDTVAKTATPIRGVSGGLLQAQRRGVILFIGPSYGNRKGSDIVERRQPDFAGKWTTQ